MGRYPGHHIVPASTWVKLPRSKQDLLRSAGGFPVNDAFLPLWNRPRTTRREIIMLYGTYGSSKTHDRILEHLVLAKTEPYFKCFYGRAVFDLAKSEFHSSIVSVIKREGWEDEFEFSEKPNGSKEISCKATGHKFKAFGCDDEESIGKGWDDATHIMVDEINQITFRQFGMLQSRIRKQGAPKALTGMFNNCDVMQDHWLVTELFNEEQELVDDKGKRIERNVIRHFSTFRDNRFIDHDEYEQQLREQAGRDVERQEAVIKGLWGVKTTGQPFYKSFKQSRDVGVAEYDPTLALHVSFDENSNPYLPCGVFQLRGKHLMCIDEIAAKNPNNKIRWVCEELYRRYGPQGKDHKAGMFVYGDATSKKESTTLEVGKNMFTLAIEYLDYFKPRLRVGRSNPNVAMRGNFINDVFEKNVFDLRITVGKQCTHMIADLMHTAEAPDGSSKDKTKTKVDGIAGVQPWGHFTDLFDYIICEAYRSYYDMFQNGGKPFTWRSAPRRPHNAF